MPSWESGGGGLALGELWRISRTSPCWRRVVACWYCCLSSGSLSGWWWRSRSPAVPARTAHRPAPRRWAATAAVASAAGAAVTAAGTTAVAVAVAVAAAATGDDPARRQDARTGGVRGRPGATCRSPCCADCRGSGGHGGGLRSVAARFSRGGIRSPSTFPTATAGVAGRAAAGVATRWVGCGTQTGSAPGRLCGPGRPSKAVLVLVALLTADWAEPGFEHLSTGVIHSGDKLPRSRVDQSGDASTMASPSWLRLRS